MASGMSLLDHLSDIDPTLAKVLQAIVLAVTEISSTLRTPGATETGSTNTFGDKQLEADVQTDRIVFERLRASGAVETASSEESSDMHALGGSGFSVAFDPLDGSSIIGANFAVGSIFGVWPGGELLGRSGRDQVAAAYGVYGSRTTLVVARPRPGSARLPGSGADDSSPAETHIVQEFALTPAGGWTLVQDNIAVGDAKLFAPANLRATADNPAYGELVRHWMEQRYTLRYSGGMVPDVNHIFAKGGGVFCSPRSPTAKPKLRLLYECAPLAFVVEAAGGASHDGAGSVLDQQIQSSGDRSIICLGSKAEVAKSVPALRAGGK